MRSALLTACVFFVIFVLVATARRAHPNTEAQVDAQLRAIGLQKRAPGVYKRPHDDPHESARALHRTITRELSALFMPDETLSVWGNRPYRSVEGFLKKPIGSECTSDSQCAGYSGCWGTAPDVRTCQASAGLADPICVGAGGVFLGDYSDSGRPLQRGTCTSHGGLYSQCEVVDGDVDTPCNGTLKCLMGHHVSHATNHLQKKRQCYPSSTDAIANCTSRGGEYIASIHECKKPCSTDSECGEHMSCKHDDPDSDNKSCYFGNSPPAVFTQAALCEARGGTVYDEVAVSCSKLGTECLVYRNWKTQAELSGMTPTNMRGEAISRISQLPLLGKTEAELQAMDTHALNQLCKGTDVGDAITAAALEVISSSINTDGPDEEDITNAGGVLEETQTNLPNGAI